MTTLCHSDSASVRSCWPWKCIGSLKRYQIWFNLETSVKAWHIYCRTGLLYKFKSSNVKHLIQTSHFVHDDLDLSLKINTICALFVGTWAVRSLWWCYNHSKFDHFVHIESGAARKRSWWIKEMCLSTKMSLSSNKSEFGVFIHFGFEIETYDKHTKQKQSTS